MSEFVSLGSCSYVLNMGLQKAKRGDFSLQNSALLHFFCRNDTESYYDEGDAQGRAVRALAHPLFKNNSVISKELKRLRDLLTFYYYGQFFIIS